MTSKNQNTQAKREVLPQTEVRSELDKFLLSPRLQQYREKLEVKKETILQRIVLALHTLDAMPTAEQRTMMWKLIASEVERELDTAGSIVGLQVMGSLNAPRISLKGMNEMQRNVVRKMQEKIQFTKSVLKRWEDGYMLLSREQREKDSMSKRILSDSHNDKSYFYIGLNGGNAVNISVINRDIAELRLAFPEVKSKDGKTPDIKMPKDVQDYITFLEKLQNTDPANRAEYNRKKQKKYGTALEHLSPEQRANIEKKKKKYAASSPLRMLAFLTVGGIGAIITLPMISSLIRGKGLGQSPVVPMAWLGAATLIARPDMFQGKLKTYATKLRSGVDELYSYLGTGSEVTNAAKSVLNLIKSRSKVLTAFEKLAHDKSVAHAKFTKEELRKIRLPADIIAFVLDKDATVALRLIRGAKSVSGNKEATQDLLGLLQHIKPAEATKQLSAIVNIGSTPSS